MTFTSLLTDARQCVQSCSPAGLTVLHFEILDDVAELTLAFTPEALGRVVEEQLRATGAPRDWAEPGSSVDPGSPTWAYALELAELFNEHYFKHVVFERLEGALEAVLADHGHEGTPIVVRPAYSASCLVHILRRLKGVRHRGVPVAAHRTRAA